MKRPYFSRTQPWPRGADGNRPGQRGAVSMAVLLVLFVFSGLGLAMLHASGLHLKINAFRKSSALLDCASENGLKRGLRDLAGCLEATGLMAAVPGERVEALRENPEEAFPLLLEDGLGAVFPRVLQESFGEMTWESRTACGLGGLGSSLGPGGDFIQRG